MRDNGLDVRRVYLEPGHFWYVATYEEDCVSEKFSGEFPAASAGEACDFILSGGLFAERTNPITAVSAMQVEGTFEFAANDAG